MLLLLCPTPPRGRIFHSIITSIDTIYFFLFIRLPSSPPPLHSALQLLTILGYADIILEHSARYVRLDCSIQRWPFPSLSPCRVLRLSRTNDTHHAPSAGQQIETLHLSVIRPLLLLQTFISCLFIRTFLIYYSTGEPSSSEALSSRRCLSRQSA